MYGDQTARAVAEFQSRYSSSDNAGVADEPTRRAVQSEVETKHSAGDREP